MFDVQKEDQKRERAVLVALITQQQDKVKVKEYLGELNFLASTLGIDTIHTFTQALDKQDKRTFIGKGKLEEVKECVEAEEIDTIIFDDDLSPSQVRNLEDLLKIKIYDRSLLILDIFLKRAQTAQARTQVELARSQYLLPRLTRLWTHLERQRGGTATRGGSGEKEIETDRRIIRDKITLLKKKLEKIDQQGQTQRKSRGKIVRVALVGYTNVGKSTIMRTLSKSDVVAKNELFATVDSTVRKVVLKNVPFLLTDTVGFIRKLPHNLIESFKSTLDEVREADILIHVVDVSHPSFEDQIDVVKKTLIEIGAGEKPTLFVFNKMDLYEKNNPDASGIESLKQNYMALEKDDVVFISALKKNNIDELREKIFNLIIERHYTIFPNYVPY